MRTTELQRRIMRGLLRYRGSKVSHRQLAARMLMSWEAFKAEVERLRAKTGSRDLAAWWSKHHDGDPETQAILKSLLWQKGGLPPATRQNRIDEYDSIR